MERRLSSVMKSHSTSKAKGYKSSAQERDNNSRSNAEFQARIANTGGFQPMKRRGVYVEKQSINKIPINFAETHSPEPRDSSSRLLSRRSRRPDKNNFLANVLTLLSKPTIGTQCSGPNINEQIVKTEQKKEKYKKCEEVLYDETVRRRARYKSKHLKNHVDGEIDSLIVLQSTKEIIQTPSNNSECVTLHRKSVRLDVDGEHMDWAAPNPPPDRQDLNTTPAKASYSKKVTLIPSEEETALEENRIENHVYDFFVDLLKTTLSTSTTRLSDGQHFCTNSSHVSLVIDEAVAQRLKVEPKDDIQDELMASHTKLNRAPSDSKSYYSGKFSKQYKRQKERLMSNSFLYTTKQASTRPNNRVIPIRKPPMYKTKSLPVAPKNTPRKLKKDNKRYFIDSLKHDLQFDSDDVYEKPNFFQALQTLVQRKQKQSVNFQKNWRPDDDHVCQFNRRKVLSAKSSFKKRPKSPTRQVPGSNSRQSNFSGYNRPPITIHETSSESSAYSLVVTGYDEKIEVSTHKPTRKLEPTRIPEPTHIPERNRIQKPIRIPKRTRNPKPARNPEPTSNPNPYPEPVKKEFSSLSLNYRDKLLVAVALSEYLHDALPESYF